MPTVPIKFSGGAESAGLQLVDVFLWIFKCHLEGKPLSKNLLQVIRRQSHRGNFNELSISAIESRWSSGVHKF